MKKIDLSLKNYNLSQILNTSINIVNENAKKKNVEIVNMIDNNIHVYADDTSVKTILRNLLSNAIKFSYKNSKVIVNSRLIKNNKTNSFIEITVQDYGVGIPKNDLGKLFKIESSLSTYGTEKEKGTGLGLILCKELVEKNGGKLWVESEQDKGSTFFITLKIAN